MTAQCWKTLRLADSLHPKTGVPIRCNHPDGHTGPHYGRTEDQPRLVLNWWTEGAS